MAQSDPELNLTVIMPIYNEASSVKKTLVSVLEEITSLEGFMSKLIVVESNSTDGTRQIILELKRTLNFDLILQESPKGKGNAVRNALKKCSDQWILIFDGDDEYSPTDIKKLTSLINDDKKLFIIGKRTSSNGMLRQMKKHRIRSQIMNIAHYFFASLVNFSSGQKLTDPFSMYKIFHQSLFDNVSLTANKFDIDWELVIKAGRMGATFIEVPINYISRDFSSGKKIRFFRDPVNWIAAWIKFSTMKLKK